MEKLQIDCKEYKLYSPDSLKYITDNMHCILINKIDEYKKLFDIDELNQIQINYFDDIDKFRNFIYDIRGNNNSLPDYAVGTYDKGMINAFIPNNIDINTPLYHKKLCLANHELFHILYKKYILKDDYSKRIVWYDEGMAEFMSGEKDYLNDEDEFKKYYKSVKENTKIIPNLNELEHGKSFKNEYYNGYDLSYLCIRYLNEILSDEEFKSLIKDFNDIKEQGNDIISKMFLYFDKI